MKENVQKRIGELQTELVNILRKTNEQKNELPEISGRIDDALQTKYAFHSDIRALIEQLPNLPYEVTSYVNGGAGLFKGRGLKDDNSYSGEYNPQAIIDHREELEKIALKESFSSVQFTIDPLIDACKDALAVEEELNTLINERTRLEVTQAEKLSSLTVRQNQIESEINVLELGKFSVGQSIPAQDVIVPVSGLEASAELGEAKAKVDAQSKIIIELQRDKEAYEKSAKEMMDAFEQLQLQVVKQNEELSQQEHQTADQTSAMKHFGSEYLSNYRDQSGKKRSPNTAYTKSIDKLNTLHKQGKLKGVTIETIMPTIHGRRSLAYRVGILPTSEYMKIRVLCRDNPNGNVVRVELVDHYNLKARVALTWDRNGKVVASTWFNNSKKWTPQLQEQAGHLIPPNTNMNLVNERLVIMHKEVMELLKSTS